MSFDAERLADKIKNMTKTAGARYALKLVKMPSETVKSKLIKDQEQKQHKIPRSLNQISA